MMVLGEEVGSAGQKPRFGGCVGAETHRWLAGLML